MYTSRQKITLKREALYEEVWSTPMTLLAKKYALSDVGLAKICKKMDIPRPGRGYWAKAHNGYNVKKSLLKTLTKRGREEVILYMAVEKKTEHKESPQIQRIIAFENDPANRITVAATLDDAHSIVATTAKRFQRTKNENARVVPQAERYLDIRVSESAVNRALRIMNAIAKGLDARGCELAISTDEKERGTYALVDGEKIFFYLDERVKRIDHIETPEEKAKLEAIERIPNLDKKISARQSYHWSLPRHDYLPQGNFMLCIENLSYSHIRHKWSDTKKTQRIEDHLNGVMISLRMAAEHYKKQRIEAERRERQRRKKEAREQALREQKWKLEEKIKNLDKMLADWQKSNLIRSFLTSARAVNPDLQQGSKLDRWIKWAERYANHLDPFEHFRIAALDVRSYY